MERKLFRSGSQSMLEKIRHCLTSIAVYTITFICLDDAHTKTTLEATDDEKDSGLIDNELTNYLTEKKAINWCRTTSKMVAIRNNSRGRSSLLRAVSMSIWGVEDRETETFLQQLMDVNLSSARESARFKERWENESKIRSNPKKSSSWEEVCKAFKDDKGSWDERTSDVDSIHIFTLANCVKRPIAVIEANEDDDNHDQSSGISGLYLPSLVNPDHCYKSPIILAYRNGRFNPIVVDSAGREAQGRQVPRIRGLPLVSQSFEQLQIRNLADEENQKQGIKLLNNYLKVEEIPCTGPNALNLVLTARLMSSKPKVIVQREICPNASLNQKFSETCYTQKTIDITDHTNALVRSSGLICSDPQCSRPVDPKYNPKCSEHGSSDEIGLSPASKTGDEDDLNVRISFESRNKSRIIDHNSPSNSRRCVVSRCERPGAEEYEGKCYLCYVVGDEESSWQEPKETCESGGLKSSEELAREELDKEQWEFFGNRRIPFHLGTTGGIGKWEETRYERQMSEQPRCSTPMCPNSGQSTYNGLCIGCFNAKWGLSGGVNQAKDVRPGVVEVTNPVRSSGFTSPTLFVTTKVKCLTEGCQSAVDNQDIGLCKSCLDQQRHVLEEFEQKKQRNGSRRTPSPGFPARTPTEKHGTSFQYGDLSRQGQPLPGQHMLHGLVQTKPRPGYQRVEEVSRARMCLSSSCDRFGDPGFGGFCSVCFVKRS